jgi:hypothetical protein
LCRGDDSRGNAKTLQSVEEVAAEGNRSFPGFDNPGFLGKSGAGESQHRRKGEGFHDSLDLRFLPDFAMTAPNRCLSRRDSERVFADRGKHARRQSRFREAQTLEECLTQ